MKGHALKHLETFSDNLDGYSPRLSVELSMIDPFTASIHVSGDNNEIKDDLIGRRAINRLTHWDTKSITYKDTRAR